MSPLLSLGIEKLEGTEEVLLQVTMSAKHHSGSCNIIGMVIGSLSIFDTCPKKIFMDYIILDHQDLSLFFNDNCISLYHEGLKGIAC